MAKVNCAACGKEIGLIQQVQLSDHSYLCRACAKKTTPYFEHLATSFTEYEQHQQQNVDGQKLYDAYFKKNKKLKKMCGKHVLYDPTTALVCIRAPRGQILMFGGTWYNNVFRVADLDVYESLSKFRKGSDGKNVEDPTLHMTFRNVPGIHDYAIKSDKGSIKSAIKNFDQVFNGKGFINGMKTSFKKSQAQAMAVAGIASSIKGAMGSMQNGQVVDQEALEANAAAAAANAENLFYAGREELMEKADAAIKAVLG